MRKITIEACEAFENNKPFNKSNTIVNVDGDIILMTLFDNVIAKKIDNRTFISDGGFRLSNTTKERLNGLKGVNVRTIKGKHFLNGYEWDGSLTVV